MLALNQTNRHITDKVLVEYHIFDINSPIIITFSPAGYVLTTKDIEQGRNAWGFTLFKKMKINVIAFTAINEKHWFVLPEVDNYIKGLAPLLEQFPERLGYGASMGAFASTFYANELKLDRLLLITPMNIPKRINNDINFDYAKNFKGEIALIYDPLCPVDKLCALKYPQQTQYLKFYSVGHQVIESLSNIGFLKTLVLQFIKNKINPKLFAIEARKRKNLERYYSYLKRNPTKKNTVRRKEIILYRFIKWNIANPTASIQKVVFKLKKGVKKRLQK